MGNFANSFINDTVLIGSEPRQLDHLFGWFIGAYLAEGNINGRAICITNMSEHYVNNVTKLALEFDLKYMPASLEKTAKAHRLSQIDTYLDILKHKFLS